MFTSGAQVYSDIVLGIYFPALVLMKHRATQTKPRLSSSQASRPSQLRTLAISLVFVGLLSQALSQVIVTSTNTEGAYTTGNMLDLADRLELYSPPTYDIPMLLDAELYSNITKYQDYKNNWIIDMSNIDPQEFAPEDPNYTLAVQRRGIPFFYLGKIFIIVCLLLLVSRLFYGYLGGFRQKVKILKSPQKRIGNRIIIIGTALYFFFSSQYIVATYYSIDTTQKYLTSIIYKYAQDSDSNLKTAFVSLHLTSERVGRDQQQLTACILRSE